MPTEIVLAKSVRSLKSIEKTIINNFLLEYDPIKIFPKIIADNEFIFLPNSETVQVVTDGRNENRIDYQEDKILDYPRLVLAMLKNEYNHIFVQIKEFLNQPWTFRDNLVKLCQQRSEDGENSFGFELFPDSPANQLLCALVNYLFPEKERMAILLPHIKSFFSAELPELQKQPGMTASAYRNAILNLTPVLVEIEPAKFTTANLRSVAFAGAIGFYIPSLFELSLNQQKNFYWFIHNKFPNLAESIYTHNADISHMAADMQSHLENAPPAEMIKLLIRDLRPVGTQASGVEFADPSANRGFERFKKYLYSLSAETQNQLLALPDKLQSSGKTLRGAIEYLNEGNCVELASGHFDRILRSNSNERILNEQPKNTAILVKTKQNEYTTNLERMSSGKEFAKFPWLPKKLLQAALCDVKNGNIYINLFKSLPLEYFPSLFGLYIKNIDFQHRLIRSMDEGLLDGFPDKKQKLTEMFIDHYKNQSLSQKLTEMFIDHYKNQSLSQSIDRLLNKVYVYQSKTLTAHILKTYPQECTEIFAQSQSAVAILNNYVRYAEPFSQLLVFLPENQVFTLLTQVPSGKYACLLVDKDLRFYSEHMFAAIAHMPNFDALVGIDASNESPVVDIKSLALYSDSLEYLRALLMALPPEKLCRFLDININRVVKTLKGYAYYFFPIFSRLLTDDLQELMSKHLPNILEDLTPALKDYQQLAQMLLPYFSKEEAIKLLKAQVWNFQNNNTFQTPWGNADLFKAYLNRIPEDERYGVLKDIRDICPLFFRSLANLPYFQDILELLPMGHRLSLLGLPSIEGKEFSSLVLHVALENPEFVKTFFTSYIDKEAWQDWLVSEAHSITVLAYLMNYPKSIAALISLCAPDAAPDYLQKALERKIRNSDGAVFQQLIPFINDKIASKLMAWYINTKDTKNVCAEESLWKSFIEKFPENERWATLKTLKKSNAETIFLDKLYKKNPKLFLQLVNLLPVRDRLEALGENSSGRVRLASFIDDSEFFKDFLQFTPQKDWENWLSKKVKGKMTCLTSSFYSPDSLAVLLSHFPPEKGRDLHLMSEFPPNPAQYKNSYVFIKKNDIKELYYIKRDCEYEIAKIDDFNLFEQNINNLKNQNDTKLHLSEEQIQKVITSNGGHTPEKPLPDYIRKGLTEVIFNRGNLPYKAYKMLKPYCSALEYVEMLAAQPTLGALPLWKQYSSSISSDDFVSLLTALPENKRWPALQRMGNDDTNLLCRFIYHRGGARNIAPILALLPVADAKAALHTQYLNGRTLAHSAISNEEFAKLFFTDYCQDIDIDKWFNPLEGSLKDDLQIILGNNKTLFAELLKLYPPHLPLPSWLEQFILQDIVPKIADDLNYLELIYPYLGTSEFIIIFHKANRNGEKVWKRIWEKDELLVNILDEIPLEQRYSLLEDCNNSSTNIFFELLLNDPALFFKIYQPLPRVDKDKILQSWYGRLLNLALRHEEFAKVFFHEYLTMEQLGDWMSNQRRYGILFQDVLDNLRQYPRSLDAVFALYSETKPLPNALLSFVRRLAESSISNNWQYYQYIFPYLSDEECMKVLGNVDPDGRFYWQSLIKNTQALAFFVARQKPEELWHKLSRFNSKLSKREIHGHIDYNRINSSFMMVLYKENPSAFFEVFNKMPKEDQLLAMLQSKDEESVLIDELRKIPNFFSNFFASDLDDAELLRLLHMRYITERILYAVHVIYRFPDVLKALLEARPQSQRMAILQLEKNWYKVIESSTLEIILNALSEEDKLNFINLRNWQGKNLLHKGVTDPEIYNLLQAYYNRETLQQSDNDGMTVLHEASQCEDVLKELFAAHPKLEWVELLANQSVDGNNVLHYSHNKPSAALQCIWDILDDDGRRRLLKAQNNAGDTPLHHIVCKREHFDAIQSFNCNEFLDIKNKLGDTPLHYAKKDILLLLLGDAHRPVPPDPDRVFTLFSQRNESDKTPFHKLIGDPTAVEAVLKCIPVEKRLDFIKNQSHKKESLFELLIEKGADKALKVVLDALPPGERESALTANNTLEGIIKKLNFWIESDINSFLLIIDQLSLDKLKQVWDMLDNDPLQVLNISLNDSLWSLCKNSNTALNYYNKMLSKLENEPRRSKAQLLAYTAVLLGKPNNNLADEIKKYRARVHTIPKLPTEIKVLCFILAATIIGIVPAIIIGTAYKARMFNRHFDVCNKAEQVHKNLSPSNA